MVKSNLNSTIVCHPTERKEIRELTEFNEIFSADILMNKRYNAPIILFKNFLHFFKSINFEPCMFVNLCYTSKIRGSKLTDLKKCKNFK